ncbi:MAG TPA: hypothetical protein PK890_06760 [Terrimesophilobacter sp.]|nr:hypothetical protein [Terrimesophilobacter sp.]
MTPPLRPTSRGSGAETRKRSVLDRRGLRLPFLIPGGASLLLGLYAAVVLLGFPNLINLERIGDYHAPLMVFGFVGTLIVLERSVAARRAWGYVSPALLGLGSLSLITALPETVGKTAIALGFVVLLGLYWVVWLRQPAAATGIQILGAASGLSAALLWLGGAPVVDLVPGMASFLILTIAGERLELGRISPSVTTRVEGFGLGASVALAAAATLAPLHPLIGYPLFGVTLLVIVGWAARFDVATRLVRSTGLPRYMAVCLLAGYVWLVVAGLSRIVVGEISSGWMYDAVLHSVFLGFVMSMIMAHAPVILPAVLRVSLPYRPFLYAPVALLHEALAVRVIGDVRQVPELVTWGGYGNVAALLLFVVLAVTTAILGVPANAKPYLRVTPEVAAETARAAPPSAEAASSEDTPMKNPEKP